MSLEKIKKQELAKNKAELEAIARAVVGGLAQEELAAKVAQAANITPELAVELLNNTKLEQTIHDQLCEKITQGAIAIKAIEKLQEKVAEGNMRAIQMVMAFNQNLKPQVANTLRDVVIQNDRAIIQLGGEAQKLLGEKTE